MSATTNMVRQYSKILRKFILCLQQVEHKHLQALARGQLPAPRVDHQGLPLNQVQPPPRERSALSASDADPDLQQTTHRQKTRRESYPATPAAHRRFPSQRSIDRSHVASSHWEYLMPQ